MGNRKNKLTWTWPLISIEWVPEILASIKNLIEPSWEGMRRQMTMNVPNRAFGNRLFSQVQALLIETKLVSENGRFIKATNGYSNALIKEHLIDFFNNSSQNWAEYYRVVFNKEAELYFDQIKKDPPQEWSKISDYVVFKQWAEFFHFLGLGTLLRNNHFVPESIINNNSKKTLRFVETSIKSYGDPRKLTGGLSLHTEADFLTWTRGEDYLPLSDDPELFPRIPYQMIIDEWEKRKYQSGSWQLALVKGKNEWYGSIKKILLEYPFSDLNSFVYTCKHLLDYFLFGKPRLDSDHLDTEELSLTKNKWSMIENFKLSEQIWKLLPNLYKDITKLYWGIAFYRNSLQRPFLSENLYDQTIFDSIDFSALRKIPIRCYRSRRTIQAILKNLSIIYKSLLRLAAKDTRRYYELGTKKFKFMITTYLPPNELDRVELLKEIEGLIELNPQEKSRVLNASHLEIVSEFPQNELLQMCYWVNRYHELVEYPNLISIHAIKDRLEILKNRLIREIKQFENGQQRWEMACNRLVEKVRLRRPV